MAMNRRKLQAAVLLLAVFLTPATQTSPVIRSALRDIKTLADNLIKFMQKDSTCVPQKPEEPRVVGCIKKHEINNSNADCALILTFDAYFSDAIDLNVGSSINANLQKIKERMWGLPEKCCKSNPTAKSCKQGFTEETDRDYEKFCNVLSLVELFTLWLQKSLNQSIAC
ncbi:hypothetical protein SRHO_G00261390 [Serrasalmus rhombeus]